jgi:hypothetical protein
MRRAIATAAASGAVLVSAGGAGASSAACPDTLTWHSTRYTSVAVRAHVPVGRRLGKGTLASSCRTTQTGGGYGVAWPARAPGAAVLRVVRAVDGVRPNVAITIAGTKPSLYVSRTPPTSAERRVLRRLRGG